MSDRVYFSLAGLAAVLILALALVWPQGLGARSPGPFRRPLGPVDPEVTAAANAQRKPVRPRYRPTVFPSVAPASATPPATAPEPGRATSRAAPAASPAAPAPGSAPPLRDRAADIPAPGGRA